MDQREFKEFKENPKMVKTLKTNLIINFSNTLFDQKPPALSVLVADREDKQTTEYKPALQLIDRISLGADAVNNS